MKKLVGFFMLEDLPVDLYTKVLPFYIWFYSPLLRYDVSMYILVELIVTIPTIPRSSKTESGCERYVRFRFAFSAVFTGPEVPVLRTEFPDPRIYPAKFPAQSSGPCLESFLGLPGRSGGPEIPG